MYRISFALLFCLNSQTAYAQSFAGRGAGTTTCAEFAQQYRIDPAKVEGLYFSWAQGFMSGQNFGAKVKRDLGGNIATQQGLLRMYCADNPLRSYLEAVLDLYGKQKPIP